MGQNSSSNGATPHGVPEPESGNVWSRLRIARAQKALLATTRFNREQLRAANARALAAIDEAQEAQAILDADRVRTDPAGKRQGSLSVAVAIATAVAVIDLLPAYWAAQALGEGETDTRLVTLILVAGLTGFAALMSHFRNRREMGTFYVSIFFTAVLVAVQTGLRFRYLRVTTDDSFLDAALQAGLLACISGGLVWIGYVKLVSAESWPTFVLRWKVKRLERNLKRLRAALHVAGDEYSNTLDSLEILEAGRVGQESELTRQIRDERQLLRELIDEIRRTASSSGPVTESHDDVDPERGPTASAEPTA
jgi:hypothetical protein